MFLRIYFLKNGATDSPLYYSYKRNNLTSSRERDGAMEQENPITQLDEYQSAPPASEQ